MSFVALNGLDVPVHYPDSEHTNEQIGEGGRSFAGTLIDSVRTNKRTWSVTTTIRSIAEAEQLEGLLRGDGWHFDFESDLYACVKGLAPATGYAGTTISAAQYKLGAKSCKVTSGSTGPTYSCGLTADFSVGFWQYVGAWAHYWIVYDKDTTTYVEYVAGAVNTTINDTFRNAMITGGNVVLMGTKATDNAVSDVYYDDLVVLPYKVTAAMVTAHYGTAGAGLEFGDCPRLNLTGDVLKLNTAVVVRGQLNNVKHNEGVLSGAWTNQARAVSFDLIEV